MVKQKKPLTTTLSEGEIQTLICSFLSNYARRNNFIYFSVPNEHILADEKTKFRRINALKKRGLTPGVADLVIIKGGVAYFMEVKTAKGRVSDAQRVFMNNAVGAGAHYVVVRSFLDAVKVLKQWGITV